MKKTVIFDVDGVLLNTIPYHFSAWQKLFHEEGELFTEKDYLEKVNGLPRDTGIRNVLPRVDEERLHELADKKQQYFLDQVKKSTPRPLAGVTLFRHELQLRDIRIAAASSSKNAPTLLENASLAKFFQTIVSGEDFKRSKPDPEIFQVTSKRLGANPRACIVIEDSYHGIHAAKNARMKTIGILSSNDKKIAETADFIIDSLLEYKKCLAYIDSLPY